MYISRLNFGDITSARVIHPTNTRLKGVLRPKSQTFFIQGETRSGSTGGVSNSARTSSFINNYSRSNGASAVAAKSELARRIFGGLSPSYDSVLDRMTLYQDGMWKRRMLEKLPWGEGAMVLDVGCGTCVLEERFQMKGSQAVGIDITSGMIELAQQKGLKSLPMLGLADAEHLPFREESFDVVLSCYVPKYCDTGSLVK